MRLGHRAVVAMLVVLVMHMGVVVFQRVVAVLASRAISSPVRCAGFRFDNCTKMPSPC